MLLVFGLAEGEELSRGDLAVSHHAVLSDRNDSLRAIGGGERHVCIIYIGHKGEGDVVGSHAPRAIG